jgi:pseudouridine synthase
MTERLQKIIASYGISSRRGAEELILAGRVRVNDQLVTILGVKADPDCDRISVDHRLINLESKPKPKLDYILLYKPKGCICSRRDPQGRKTIQELLPTQYQHLYSVGRLDYDSSGALLLTNDGDFANYLMHPSHHVAKFYEVIVQGCPSDRILEKWRTGIDLDGKLTLPAQVMVLSTQKSSTKLQIVLHEGRNRQIRRVAEILGHPLLELHRAAIATINLGNLLPKGLRQLSSEELQILGIK